MSEVIKCSFCSKTRTQVESLIKGPVPDLYMCNECVDLSHETLHEPIKSTSKIKTVKEKFHTPEEIKAFMDDYVIGQDPAKIAISVAMYNHHKRINNKDDIEIEKSNMLMVGSSGSGKTLTVKTVSKLFNLPYVIADATTLTEAGYVGEDVTVILKRLLQNADGDLDRAQKGIVFVDEIDKKRKKADSSTVSRDVSGEGVQQALLKMVEGTVVSIEDDDGNEYDFDTKDVLFIFGGAFVGLDEVIRARKSTSTIGIGAELKNSVTFAESIKTIVSEDFINFGLIPELIGRCPIIILFEDLTASMILRILTEPKNNIVDQFKSLFKYDGVILEFDDKYLQNVANMCMKQKVGARGLRTIMENDLQATQFILPRLAKEGVKKISFDTTGTPKYVYKKKRANTNE